MSTTPLNVLDDLFLNLDRREEPWVVHVELRVTGRLEAERLAVALADAVGRHPMGRARLAEGRSTDRWRHWEIDDHLREVPLSIARCDDDDLLDAVRERHFAFSPSLDVAPPFAALLAHVPGGDVLMLNVHHAAIDGIGAFRLLESVARAYAGAPDPVAPIDPLAVRDVRRLAGSASIEEGMVRARAVMRHALRQAVPTTRIARDGGEARPAYGFALLSLSPDATAAVVERRRAPGTTVNDVLIGALAVAIRRWNARHGRMTGRVAISMPVNLRPAGWHDDVVGNFASYVTVSLSGSDHDDLAAAVAATGRSTRAIKRDHLSGTVVDLLAGPALLNVGAKRHLQSLISLTGDVVVDTASLSNLGRLEALPALGDAGPVRGIWFSPPGRMPLGATLGVLTVDGALSLTLRYRHAQFDREAAAAFLGLYRDVLLAAEAQGPDGAT